MASTVKPESNADSSKSSKTRKLKIRFERKGFNFSVALVQHTLKSHFIALKNYRNPLGHARDIDVIEQKQGEAAIIWFRRALNQLALRSLQENTMTADEGEQSQAAIREGEKLDPNLVEESQETLKVHWGSDIPMFDRTGRDVRTQEQKERKQKKEPN